MKNVLITGATGFLGTYVLNELFLQGCNIIATSSGIEKAKESKWFNKVKYIPLDLKELDDTINYYEFFQRPNLMIHLAWEGLPNYKSAFHIEENLPRHSSFLRNMIRNGLTDLTVAGTCFEYGMQEGALNENMQTFPANPYAKAKDELRKSLEIFRQQYSFSLKWVRLFYMYGKGQNPNSLLSQLDKALAENQKVFNMSGGQQERDYLPVEKIAEYIVKIALQKEVEGIINCCNGRPITIKDLVENYLQKQNKNIKLNFGYYPYPDYEPMKFWGDNSKLKRIIEVNVSSD